MCVMDYQNIFLSFIVGGVVTALIVLLEQSGFRTFSGIAALMPVFTLISYFFIGLSTQDPLAISQHSKFVLMGTIVAWCPYMIVIIVAAPKLGTNKAIGLGLFVFFILATCFVLAVERYKLFK